MNTKRKWIVMMMPVVIATGCAQAPSNRHARSTPPAEKTTPIDPVSEGSTLDRELVAAELDYLSESQGLVAMSALESPPRVQPSVPGSPGVNVAPVQPIETGPLVGPTLDVAQHPETPLVEETVRPASEGERSMLAETVNSRSTVTAGGPVASTSEVVPAGLLLFQEDPPLHKECVNLGLGTLTSIVDPCGMKYLTPYLHRVPLYEDERESRSPQSADSAVNCPPPAWWESDVTSQARPDSMAIEVDIETLLIRTLANSKYLRGLADLPLIREKSTLEAMAEFDVTSFMESHFRRPSEPVGNQLTVGPGNVQSQRLRENDFTSSAGIARKTSSGGRVQLAQQIGLFNNNSTFIDPRRQGNARLTLNITQPLMSGAGKAYNTSLIMLAQMDERVAWDEVSEQLQDYLVDVTETYWQLYLERARLKQKERHLLRGEVILSELVQRREVDAVENQIARARASVQSRRSELIRAKTTVRNTESRLRGLVNDPQLYGSSIEVVPIELPQCAPLEMSLRDAMAQALKSRSEIDKSIQKVRAAGVRLSVAKNELMPILDVVMETYLSGLRGRDDIGRAWIDQFSVGEPSYSAGLRYEIPLNNRLAKHRHERRRLEMRQAISQFEFNVEELMSEVEIAVREVKTTYDELLSRHESMVANETDLTYFQKRWELLPGDNRSASFLLEDILEAQDRVAAEESNFAQAQVNYALAIVNVKRALGILLQSERIETGRTRDCELDQYIFDKMHVVDPNPGFDGSILNSGPASMIEVSQPMAQPLLLEIETFDAPTSDVPQQIHPLAAPVTVGGIGVTPTAEPVGATQ